MFWLLGSIFLCALKSYAKLSKRVQSAKQKTKFLGLPMPSAAKLM